MGDKKEVPSNDPAKDGTSGANKPTPLKAEQAGRAQQNKVDKKNSSVAPKDAQAKKKNVGEIDITKARKIVLDAIGREKKPSQKVEKAQADPTPLFFGRKKINKLKPKKIIVSKEGAEEVKEMTSEKEEIQETPKPLFLKKEKNSDEKAPDLKKKAQGVEEIKEVISAEKKQVVEGKQIKDTSNPLFFKKVKDPKPKKPQPSPSQNKQGKIKIKKQQEIDKSKISSLNKKAIQQKIVSLKSNKPARVTSLMRSRAWSPEFLRLVIDTVLYILVFAILSFIIFYSCFVILVTQFNYDNRITRSLSQYLPIPAVITDKGIIEYYNYKDVLEKGDDTLGKLIHEMGVSKAWKLIK